MYLTIAIMIYGVCAAPIHYFGRWWLISTKFSGNKRSEINREGDCPIATWGYSGGKWMNVPPKSIVVALVAAAGTR